jgi:hypothetical protein
VSLKRRTSLIRPVRPDRITASRLTVSHVLSRTSHNTFRITHRPFHFTSCK